MDEKNELSIENILEISDLLPLPLQYLFLKSLKRTIDIYKEGEANV